MRFINPWREGDYFEVDDLVFSLGDFSIYKQFDKCYLHTYKDIAFNQLMFPNKELIKSHYQGVRPDQYAWIYDRGRKIIETRFGNIQPSRKQLTIFDQGA